MAQFAPYLQRRLMDGLETPLFAYVISDMIRWTAHIYNRWQFPLFSLTQ